MPPKSQNQATLKEALNTSDIKGMECRLLAAIKEAREDIKSEVRSEIESVKKELAETRANFKKDIEDLNAKVESDIAEMRQERDEEIRKLREHIERIEFHQRKYNLLFFGLKFKAGEEETALRDMCETKLEVVLDDTALINVHKIGEKGGMIARFARWGDRQAVLRSSKKLKGTGIGISTDLTASLQKKRAELLAQRKTLKESGHIVRMIERGMDVILQKKSAEGEWKSL